tara:strand:- start:493 stop:594 length:102 start_codon:yes stop_codon:yes gene_type:complete
MGPYIESNLINNERYVTGAMLISGVWKIKEVAV